MLDPEWSCTDGWSKEISCCSPKDILIPLPRIPFSLLRRADRSPSSEVSWYPSLTLLCATYPPKAFLGGCCLHRSLFFATFGNPCLTYYDALEPLAGPLTSTSYLHFGQNSTFFLCGLAVLHYIEMKNVLSGLWGRILHALFRFLPVRLTRFHQDLGWLSCLRSPTFRHLYIVTRVFTGHYGQCLNLVFVIPYVIGASFPLIECASCHRYLEPNGFSAPILLFSCAPLMTRSPEMDLSSLTHSSAEDFIFFEFVCLIRFIVLANDRERFFVALRT